MDDYVYFLLLIGWLAFSFYQQSVKKKKKQEQLRAAQQRQHENQYGEEEVQTPDYSTKGQEARPNFKRTLQEILLGEQLSLENIPENEAQSLETIPSHKEDDLNSRSENENIFQKYYDEVMISNPDNDIEQAPQENEGIAFGLLSPEDGVFEDNKDENYFDLRKAVIYSEILNKRYAN